MTTATAAAHPATARVQVTRNTKQQLQYTVAAAAPYERLTEIARFSAGGDAHTYAMTVRDRYAEQGILTAYRATTR